MINSGAFGAGFIFFFILWFAVGIASLVMLIVAVVDIAKRPDWQWKLAGQEKILWLLLVILVNVFAIPSLIYWFNIRKKLILVEGAAATGAYGPGFVANAAWAPGAMPMSPAMAPPGWYPDSSGQSQMRWWDGARWTEYEWNRDPSPA
jgi:uncharacterized protein DUF2510